MDKKKKNGVAANADGRKDRASSIDTPIKAKPAHIAASTSSDRNGDKAKASATPTSDKEKCSTPGKTTHTPDDANKQGPQKKRRKVTHGTVTLPAPFVCPLWMILSKTLRYIVIPGANFCVSRAFLQLAFIVVDL